MPSDLIMSPDRQLQAETTANLRAELAKSLEITARHLTRVAAIWRELESRGEDMSHLRSGLWAYMPLIASGRLRAEIVVQYAGHTMLLNRLAQLPAEDQDALLRDNTVTIVDHIDGAWQERRVPITHLRASEMSQVIGDRIRSPVEQRRAALARSRPKPQGRREPAGTIDRIAAAIPERQRGAFQVTVGLRMTAAQQDAFNAAMTERGLSASRLTTAALIAAGIIPSSGV